MREVAVANGQDFCEGQSKGKDEAGDERMGEANGDAGEASKQSRAINVDAFTTRREGVEARSPFKDGLVDDWEAFEQLMWYCIGEDSPRKLIVAPNEHPVLLTEPPFNRPQLREKAVELLFEKFDVPAVFLAKTPVLTTFASGRTTSLVVDCGHSGTTVTAVHDGYALQKSLKRSPLGGSALTQCLMADMEKGKGTQVKPHIALSKEEKPDGSFQAHPRDVSRVSQSFYDWKKREVVAMAKEEVCRVPDTPYSDEEYAHVPSQSFELPDGTTLEYGSSGFKVPELLFQPKLGETLPGGWPMDEEVPSQSVVDLALNAASSCDADVRKDLYQGVVLSGGSSLFPQFKERFEGEFGHRAPSTTRTKVMAAQSSSERRFAPFIGGSILASLGSFQQMWMSRSEYDENGPSYIQRKAP